MNISWQWKLRIVNGLCQGYFIVYAALTQIVGLGTTLPYLFADDYITLFFLKLLVLFLFFNMVANYVCIRYTAEYSFFKTASAKDNDVVLGDIQHSGSAGSTDDPVPGSYHYPMPESNVQSAQNEENTSNANHEETVVGGWMHCKDCTEMVPPRAKHCILCDACILKRDHHCFFAGCCVGFHNQRYFTIFCMYGGLGSVYSSLATHYYLLSQYEGLQTTGLFAYFLPLLLWYWAVGSASGSVVTMTFFLYWNCLSSFMCFYYFAVQIFLICRGQTKYECLKGIHFYHGNLMLNIKSVFGRYWLLGFLFPVPFLKSYVGNGKNWDEFIPNKLL